MQKKKKKNRAAARHDFSFLLLINVVQQFLNHLQTGSEMEWQQLSFVIKMLIRMWKAAGVIDPNTFMISCFSSWKYQAKLEVTSWVWRMRPAAQVYGKAPKYAKAK